jgi:hypothetical protein
MFLRSRESSKDTHDIVYLFLLFGTVLLETSLLLEVEQVARDDELLATDTLGEFVIVDIDKVELHLLLLLSIVVIKLHLCKQQFCFVVVLDLEVTTFGHVADDLGGVGTSFGWTVGLAVHGEVAALIFGVGRLLTGFTFENAVGGLFIKSFGLGITFAEDLTIVLKG